MAANQTRVEQSSVNKSLVAKKYKHVKFAEECVKDTKKHVLVKTNTLVKTSRSRKDILLSENTLSLW